MRIEEMRSGRAYLYKRSPQNGVGTFESHSRVDVFTPAPADQNERRAVRSTTPPTSDLEKSQWTVVSFEGVEAGGLTYDQATRLMAVLGQSGINGLCIITDVAALNLD